MKTLEGIFSTDGLSRDGIYMTVGALAGMLWQSWEFGTPSNVSHDALRIIGWSRATALFLEPGLTQLTGTFEMPETEDERLRLGQWAHSAQASRYDEHRDEIADLRARLASYVVDEAKHCLSGGVTLFEPELAMRAFPDLFAMVEADKDGLVPLSELSPLGAGVYQIGELTVFAHPFLRRSFSRLNTLNQPFLERLQEMQQQGIPTKVALDPDLVGLASTYLPPMEFEYWWGPKFDDDLAHIPPGATRHEANKETQFFYGISGMEFWWQSRKGLHTLEAEELRDQPVETEQAQGYLCRYAHSIINEATGDVMHFDGAVRRYDEEQMIQRLEVDIKSAGRNSDYKKLWRLDSAITVEQWKALLNDYYRDNRLVGEYLGAEPEPFLLGSPDQYAGETPVELTDGQTGTVDDAAEFDVTSLVPHAMDAGSGIRLAFSYCDNYQNGDFVPEIREAKGPEPERRVIPFNYVGGEQVQAVVESATVELQKALVRNGKTLVLPPIAGVTIVHDDHHDFGLIAHGEAASEQTVHQTLNAIHALTEAWERRNWARTVAFTVAFPLEGKQAQIAVIGHVTDVNRWLANPLSRMPTDRDELHRWLERVAGWLRETYTANGRRSPLLSAATPFEGSLMVRKVADKFVHCMKDDDISFEIAKEHLNSNLGLKTALDQGVIVPTMRSVVSRMKCLSCQGDYLVCNCSKSLDEGVKEQFEEVVCIDVVWTQGRSQNLEE